MFPLIEIALVNNGTVLSTNTAEYEILEGASVTCLIRYELLQQLKISTLKFGYCIIDNKCVFLREVNHFLELVDDTVRFDIDKNSVLNVNDIYLLNSFLRATNLSKGLVDVYAKWGKRIEWYYDIFETNQGDTYTENWFKAQFDEDADSEVLRQRFSILLNQPFLDKLKTYLALWKQRNNVVYELPSWYSILYQTDNLNRV
jgi:hypothetical protein